MEDKHLRQNIKNDKEQPDNGLPLRREEPKSVWRYKRLWAVVLLFLFIGGVGGFVPAAKIPLFSRLVQAMGFKAEEAGEMSLLKALLKWHQKYQESKADELSAEQIAANAEASAARGMMLGEYELEQNRHNLDSLLISMRKLNSEQRRKGERVDAVRGSVKHMRGEEKEPEVVQVGNIDSSVVATESNTEKKGQIFFGEDAGVVQRGEQHGFNSTKMLTKIENPHIAGSTSSTWLTNMIDKAMLHDAKLGQLPKELNAKGHAVNFDDIKKIGDDRPHRDMYYAWLTGKTTYRTPNRLLKKTLAGAGFNGEDMPKRVFDSSLLGVGVGIDPNDVNADAQGIKDRMAKDKSCQAQVLTGSAATGEAYVKIRENIKGLGGSFPTTCEEVLKDGSDGAFRARLADITKQCNAINSNYEEMKSSCNVAYTKGKCKDLTNSYNSNFETFKTACEKVYDACMGETVTDEEGNTSAANTPEDCVKRRDESKGEEICSKDCTGKNIQDEVRNDITGYTDDSTFEGSAEPHANEDGTNTSDYMASQSVQNIIDTLSGKMD